MSQFVPPSTIDLRLVIRIFLNALWTIVSLSAAAAVLSICLAFMLPVYYKADTTLAASEDLGAVSSISPGLGGLASIAGISLGGGGVDNFSLSLEVLKSKQFLIRVINKYAIKPQLLAVKSWNAESDALVFDGDKYDGSSKEWCVPGEVYSDLKAYAALDSIISISQSEKIGLVNVEVKHKSATFAKFLVEVLVEEINSYMRKRDIDEAVKSIQYLESQVKATPLADMRNVFFQLIEDQQKKKMLADVRNEYVFTIVDPPVVPETRSSPNRVLIVIVGALAGLFFSLLFVLLKEVLFGNDLDRSVHSSNR
ncbi:GNVR domain-containing protein [Teredinibacter turnerae]|uniref:GNVR domain-containing protein n=1 Tax=Teredinibacter turnerae TaxID=2426 RepID=UPI0003A5D830|nr:GNVR domain-containing protein [Teredinibacter turnerae]